MNNITLAFLALTLLAAPLPAAARTVVSGVEWELSALQGKKRGPYAPVAKLAVRPGTKYTDKVRAVVALRNPSPKGEEGLVLRYALRFQLLKKGEPKEKAFWEVPFQVDEMRVAAVKAGAEKKARVLNLKIAEQLRRLGGSGFAPVALKMEIMLSPRAGDAVEGLMLDSVIEVAEN